MTGELPLLDQMCSSSLVCRGTAVTVAVPGSSLCRERRAFLSWSTQVCMQGIREAELGHGSTMHRVLFLWIHSDPQKEQARIIMGSFQIQCGARKQEAENRKQEVGGRKQEAGNRRPLCFQKIHYLQCK